jgi:nucleoid-associated protein YgaU
MSDRYPDRRGDIRKFQTTIYDTIPIQNSDIQVISQEGDRLDNLAYQYYGNPALWWFIARANGMVAMNVPAGTLMRIPISYNDIAGT